MPKEIFLPRLLLIINRLERGPASFEQILKSLDDESSIQDRNFSISRRTLQRDIKDISFQLHIEIASEKKGERRYFIKSKEESQGYSQRLLDSYQITNAINASQKFAHIVFPETRKPRGLAHFYSLLNAISNKKVLYFQHYKYWDETLTNRTVHPLALKESQGRWYLIAVDTKDNKIKTFGLDRMSEIDVSKSKFRETYSCNVKEMFSNAFGIINEENEEPQLVRLKFTYQEGQYVKTYPLHTSQQIIADTDKEVIIELYVYLSYDFIKELLSFGAEMVVISPEKLRNQIKDSLMNVLELYK